MMLCINKWLNQIQICIKCVKIWNDVDKWSNKSQYPISKLYLHDEVYTCISDDDGVYLNINCILQWWDACLLLFCVRQVFIIKIKIRV